MGTARTKWYSTSPMPDNLPDAIDEIARLRSQLHLQNQQLERMAEKKELGMRSLLGSIRAFEKRFKVQVIVDKALPQGEMALKTDDGQTVRIVAVGMGQADESAAS